MLFTTKMRVSRVGVETDYYYIIDAVTSADACETLKHCLANDENEQMEFSAEPLERSGGVAFVVANYMPMTWGVTAPDHLEKQVAAYKKAINV